MDFLCDLSSVRAEQERNKSNDSLRSRSAGRFNAPPSKQTRRHNPRTVCVGIESFFTHDCPFDVFGRDQSGFTFFETSH